MGTVTDFLCLLQHLYSNIVQSESLLAKEINCDLSTTSTLPSLARDVFAISFWSPGPGHNSGDSQQILHSFKQRN